MPVSAKFVGEWARELKSSISMLILLLVLLAFALLGGGYGHSRVGYYGWSPAGIIVVILVVLMLTGRV
jgi:hypothetical protein